MPLRASCGGSSLWTDIESLADFVYDSAHRAVMVRRREWFERLSAAYLVLWWVPAGHVPTPEEALGRLDRLRRDGPTPLAFTFRRPFGSEEAAAAGGAAMRGHRATPVAR
jgi:Domain of unknown function (DUF3291)